MRVLAYYTGALALLVPSATDERSFRRKEWKERQTQSKHNMYLLLGFTTIVRLFFRYMFNACIKKKMCSLSDT